MGQGKEILARLIFHHPNIMEIYEDQTDDAPSIDEREEAFQAAVTDWRMKKLEPFSISRRAFFLSWRGALKLPSLSDLLSQDMDAFLEDAIRLLWLCLKPSGELEDLRAMGFSAMQKACDDWANENIEHKDIAQVILTGLKIWNNSAINRHAPEVDPDHSPDLPGKP